MSTQKFPNVLQVNDEQEITMSTFASTGRAASHRFALRLPLALASALLSVSAWAADGVIHFRGAIVAPPCNTQISTSGTASVSCPANGTHSAESASLPLLPGRVVQLTTARAFVVPVQFAAGPGSGNKQGYVVVTEYN
ncbi:hypothetical protein [Cupriavidus basilensis]|uniref:hypothetical protein n=1 Tax=Cupriavidus basilensis TaxID=68895 RepID=UPI0023E76ACC|nr:hypothetical protein [Cupriavidus basilensis]